MILTDSYDGRRILHFMIAIVGWSLYFHSDAVECDHVDGDGDCLGHYEVST